MSRSALLGIAVNAIVLGLAITLLGGDDRVVSLEVWLAAALACAILLAGRAVNQVVPVAPIPPRPLLQRRTNDPTGGDARTPKGLRSIEQVVIQSVSEGRVYAAQLQPRLQRLVADRNLENIPSDLRWMLQRPISRAPTVSEIDRFLDAATTRPPNTKREHVDE